MNTLLDFLAYWLGHRPLCAAIKLHPRSSKWPAVRRAYLAKNPKCEVCGEPNPDVHHLQPYHLHPELELDESNLIALGRECGHHLTFGHLGDFKSINPDCKADVATWKAKYQGRKYGEPNECS